MNAQEFVKNFYLEKQNILNLAFDQKSKYKTVKSAKIEALNLSLEQTEKLKEITSDLLTDSFYTILLGLDGSGSIGESQESFKIYDEENNLISEDGDLESLAYEYFHQK
ncbi:hypothetical protein [Chryseobacterium cheonjiense]|uniref:Uncharacterized protein n=1 Tax=Chryseobacterium cheonjiense TaxID=2728845 RepID=A0A7Y0A6P9_9FLAO|nr:hypothetical protein [Chryseobacterium cheonjiense]NML57448.1 hypothetical protein [Chryseobacterium cheonjiense]